MRPLSVLLAMLLGLPACDATVVLGTDCPPLRGACPGAPDDAGDTPADAGDPWDAGAALFPPFQNPSFELAERRATGNLASGEIPSAISPWYACRAGLSVLSSARAGNAEIAPTDGATFLSDSFPAIALNITGLYQDLSAPLRAGRRYAFVLDLWSEGGATSDLELYVLGGLSRCLSPAALMLLGSSGPLADGGWRRTCIAFEPARDVSTIGLMVGAPEDFLNFGARLYVDNIRAEPDCF